MKKTTAGLLTLILVGFCLLIPSNLNTVGSVSTYKISGYILNSKGNGVAGARVTFVSGRPLPSYSDNSGYYGVFANSGINSVSVFPPSDSNYVEYNQKSFNVQSNMTVNFTLSLGYRLSG